MDLHWLGHAVEFLGIGVNSKDEGTKLFFGQIVFGNCLQMKEIGQRGQRQSMAPP